MSILKDYYKYDSISREREKELFENIKNEENREELIKSHLKLVASIAKKYSFLSPPMFEDLVQEGTLGLVLAIDKFDPSLGFRFSTFASFYIRNGIRQILRKSSFFLHVPTKKLYQIFKLINEMRKSKILHNDDVSLDDVCDMMKCSKSQAMDMLSIIFSERTTYNDGKTSKGIDVEKLDEKLKLMEIIEALNYFPKIDRDIINLRYNHGKSWRDISTHIGMSHEGCRKRHDRVIDMIRHQLTSPEKPQKKQSKTESCVV